MRRGEATAFFLNIGRKFDSDPIFTFDCYKIKLKTLGYRLVYEIAEDTITVTVIAIGKRERGEIYARAQQRVRK